MRNQQTRQRQGNTARAAELAKQEVGEHWAALYSLWEEGSLCQDVVILAWYSQVMHACTWWCFDADRDCGSGLVGLRRGSARRLPALPLRDHSSLGHSSAWSAPTGITSSPAAPPRRIASLPSSSSDHRHRFTWPHMFSRLRLSRNLGVLSSLLWLGGLHAWVWYLWTSPFLKAIDCRTASIGLIWGTCLELLCLWFRYAHPIS